MKTLPPLILILVSHFPAFGQDSTFDGKIKLVAPERSGWEVTLRPTAAMRIEEREKSRTASVEELPLTPVDGDESLVRLKVEKSGALFHETSYFANGTKTEKWGLGAVQFRDMPGRDQLVMAGMNLMDSDFSDHSKEDFEELGWLSKEFYKGSISYNKMPCFLFQTTSDKRALTRREAAVERFMNDTSDGVIVPDVAPPSITPVTVIISAATRLPVLYNDGRILRTYSFDSGPFQQLVPPPKFAREFNAWRAHLAESQRRPSAP